MVYKRSFGDEETFELPCKHQRQLDYCNHLPSFADIAPCNDVTWKPHSLVGEGGAFCKSQGVERLGNGTEHTTGFQKEFGTCVRGGISNLSWVSSSTGEEDLRSEAAVKLLFAPDVLEAGCSTRMSVHDEKYSALLDSPPRKLVPVGSEHQAIIPQYAASNAMIDEDNWERLTGTCLLPMPDSEALVHSSGDLGHGRADNCKCSDKGAVRCIQQHICEAREKLRDLLGQEKFMKLGLYEMGETVARKWTTEEEQLFEDIVFTNTPSEDKNFWARLSEVFPCRSKMDLVSYYFNVFMLRRRAEQNRLEDMKIAPFNHVPHKPCPSVGEVGAFSRSQRMELVGNVTECSIGVNKESETTVPFSWGISTSEEDSRSEAAVKLVVFPDGLEGCTARSLVQYNDIYSSLLDSPPRKLVPVGSDHQAIIPHRAAASNIIDDNEDLERLMGTCVLPRPDSEQLAYSNDEVGKGRVDNCMCSDRGAVRCVQQHIFEARDKLKDFLGQEIFLKLGFYEMGEIVARKWTQDEQQIFRNVVFLNPASYGKNFWTQLSEVFPSRSKMDLVSYYFNCFMLRRRAEQNRSDHMGIDSDNDEWQNSDDGDESGMSDEEEEDSGVESQADRDDAAGDRTYDNNGNDNVVDDWVASREVDDDGGIDVVSESGLKPTLELEDKNLKSRREDLDVQDDSCTSYECHPSGVDHNNQLQGSFNDLRDGANHSCEMEPCDTKVWNVGYLTGSNSDIDLLPTSNMIKEVFGDEDWNRKD